MALPWHADCVATAGQANWLAVAGQDHCCLARPLLASCLITF